MLSWVVRAQEPRFLAENGVLRMFRRYDDEG